MISLVSSVLAMSLLMSPHGQYKTTVRVPMITRQDITIDVKTRTIGCITLKGAINMSEDFVFAKNKSSWNIVLGERIQRMMRKTYCDIRSIAYDEVTDSAIVQVTLPMLGKTTLTLRKL